MCIGRMPRHPGRKDAVARGEQGIGRCRRGARLGATGHQTLARILRNDGQRQRLGQGEVMHTLMEIHKAGRARAFDVAAVRRVIQIGLEDRALAVARFEPERGGDLLEFAAHAAAVDAVDATRQLHGDGGTALAIAAEPGRESAAHQRKRIHTRMPVIPAVFVKQHRFGQRRRHLIERHPEPELIVGCETQAQQLAALGMDGRRMRRDLRQGRGRQQAQGDEHCRQHRRDDERAPRAAA